MTVCAAALFPKWATAFAPSGASGDQFALFDQLPPPVPVHVPTAVVNVRLSICNTAAGSGPVSHAVISCANAKSTARFGSLGLKLPIGVAAESAPPTVCHVPLPTPSKTNPLPVGPKSLSRRNWYGLPAGASTSPNARTVAKSVLGSGPASLPSPPNQKPPPPV